MHVSASKLQPIYRCAPFIFIYFSSFCNVIEFCGRLESVMNVIIYGGGVISISKPSSSIVEDYTDYIQTYYITSSSTHNYRSRWAVGSSILHVHAQFYSSKVSHTVCMTP